ncbi:MAG: hypothetical protein EYC68_22465 [Chloroflexota bacterium]|nr:MAG: hypothetical protein EYC68_22465 [Chloroflexota bacterium]
MIIQIQTWLAQHFKSADDVGTGFGIAMFVCVGLGSVLNIERLISLGLAFFGAAVVAWGVNAMQTRELRIFQHGIRVSEQVQEILARAWGIVFIGGGAILMGYGILEMVNPRTPVPTRVQQFFGTASGSGVLLLVGSAIGMLYALTMLFASEARGSNGFVRFVTSLPGRLFGLVLVLVFATLALIALLQIFAPVIWETLWQSFWQRL